MRVIQLTSSSAGGVARHARQVASLLSATKRVLLAGPPDVVAGATVPTRIVDIADRPRLRDLVALCRLRVLARDAHILHAHGLRAGAAAVLATRLLPHRPAVVVTLHNLPVGGATLQRIAGVLEVICARGADVVLGVSGDLVARAAARGARGARRALVPAPARPRTSGVDLGDLRREVGVAPGEALILTVGRLAPQKGLDLLCDAARRLGETGAQPLRWVVVGDGPLAPDLRERIAQEQLPIALLGPRDDVADLMVAADVVVSTSTWEGQPLVVQEALQVGAAIVATDVGGTAEVTGSAAELVAADGAALAAGISAVLADPERHDELRRAAAERAARLPGPAEVVAQLNEIYDEAHGARGAAR
ncbi:MAG TPA: glycosyltransferase [Actinomycetaceae bacterium]|nr:glycosyltransferase [Actinomycetaceae bacterium]